MSDNKELAVPTIRVMETQTIEKEIVVDLPCFVQYSKIFFYKIIARDKTVEVAVNRADKQAAIEIKDNCECAFNLKPYSFITEEEFNAKYAEAMKRITEQSGVKL